MNHRNTPLIIVMDPKTCIPGPPGPFVDCSTCQRTSLPSDCHDSYNLRKKLVTLLRFKNLRLVTFAYLLSLLSVMCFLRPTKFPSSSRREGFQ